jgi:hypothetical protein
MTGARDNAERDEDAKKRATPDDPLAEQAKAQNFRLSQVNLRIRQANPAYRPADTTPPDQAAKEDQLRKLAEAPQSKLAPPSNPTDAQRDGTTRCPLCAEAIQAAAVICKHCKMNLHQDVQPVRAAQPTAQAKHSPVDQASTPGKKLAASLKADRGENLRTTIAIAVFIMILVFPVSALLGAGALSAIALVLIIVGIMALTIQSIFWPTAGDEAAMEKARQQQAIAHLPTIKVLDGDLPSGLWKFDGNSIVIPLATGTTRKVLIRGHLTEVKVIATKTTKDNAAKWGVIAGAAVAGPIGAGVGYLAGKNSQVFNVLCRLDDGRKFVVAVNEQLYNKLVLLCAG